MLRKKLKSPQALSILEHIALFNAEERILKNVEVPIDQEHDVSQIEDTDKIRVFLRAFSENATGSENGKQIIDINGFKEACEIGLGEWDIEVNISEEQVGDCHDVDNHELEEVQVNIALDGDRQENPTVRINPTKFIREKS